MLGRLPPPRPISARQVGNDAKYAPAEARRHRPIVWDRVLVILVLVALGALGLVLIWAWVLSQ